MIEIIDLSFRYKKKSDYAIRHAQCRVESRGIIAIVGRSGAGKSTFISVISGIYTPRDKNIGSIYGGIMIDGHKPDQLRGPQLVSWVPQQPALLDHLTVSGNILLPMTMSGVTYKPEENSERIAKMIDRLGMNGHKYARPRELSGGQRTRVSLARALISRPRFLFLDEPFTSLDVGTRWEMYKLLREERSGEGLCTIVTTHDIPEAMLLADRVILMDMSDGTTTMDIYENNPMDLGAGGIEDLLTEARRRAPAIEGRIYS